jgi:hypothetical protein
MLVNHRQLPLKTIRCRNLQELNERRGLSEKKLKKKKKISFVPRP